MSEVKQANFNPVIPEKWQEKYSDVVLKETANNREYLFGIDKDSGNKHRLPMGILDLAVEEGYGIKPGPCQPEKDSGTELSQLHQQFEELGENYKRSLEQLADALNKLEGFERYVGELKSRNTELQDQNSELESQLREALAANVKETPTQEEILVDEFGWAVGRNQAVMLREDDGFATDGWMTISEPVYNEEEEGWHIDITNGEDNQTVRLEDLIRLRLANGSSPPPTDSDPESAGWFSRVLAAPNLAAGRGLTNLMTRRSETVYEYDNDGRVINETRKSRGVSGFGAAAIAVGAVVLFELIEHKIWGHSPSRESRQIAQNHADEMKTIHANHISELKAIAGSEHLGKVRHLQEIDLIAKDHTAEMNVIAAHDAKMTAQHVHDHYHELRAINGNETGPSAYYAHGVGPHAGGLDTSTGNFSNYNAPWNWAHEKYGVNAENTLHVLGNRAAKDGHKVRWILDGFLRDGSRKEILQVDGTTNTQSVLRIINQYK